MAYSERETRELLNRIADALWFVFTEEEKTRTPEFEQEIKEFEGRIAADWTRIGEIDSSAKPDRLMVTILRGKIDALWKESVLATEQRGSFADRKFIHFMALIFPSFGITDFPSRLDPDAKLLMELMSRPSIAN